MHTVRRTYVYFITAISLIVLAVGLTNLLGLALEQVAEAFGWRSVISRDPESVRQQVSLYTALVVVALPIWLVHWWLAERSILPSNVDAEEERQSAERAFYVAAALLLSFVFWQVNSQDLIRLSVHRLFGNEAPYSGDAPTSIAALIVVSAIWAVHVRVRQRDLTSGRLIESGMWLPRLYRYVAMFVGAMLLLFGAADLLEIIGDSLFGVHNLVLNDRWWVQPLASGIAGVVTGGLAWAAHWWYSSVVLERGDWISLDERQSMLRRVHLYLVILVCVVVTLLAAGSSIETVLRAILDAPEGSGTREFVRHLVEPLVGALPFVGFWLFHRTRLQDESARFAGPALSASTHRFYIYGLALVGLVFTGVGAAYTAGILIDLVLGGTKTVNYSAEWWRGQVSQFGALALAGMVVWLWHWYLAQVRRHQNPTAERWTMSRRIFIYTTLASSLVVTLGSLSVIVYRLFNVLLNVTPSGGLVSSVSGALGTTIIAGGVLVYHGLILRQDSIERPAPAEVPVTLPLTLTGPPGADLDAELDSLRAHLSEGFDLSPRPR